VSDTGIGIPADELDHIFEMFAQVDPTLERNETGLGIGLTLVKRLVELHGGRIAVRSEGPGRGSEFEVRLPIANAESAVPTVSSRRSRVPVRAEGRRVLIVDDNETARRASPSCSGSGAARPHRARRRAGDRGGGATAARLILLDIGMPRLNGYDACRRIRALPHGRHAVILAMTGWGQDEDRRRSRGA
jgi:CheY-like chemotaxis protein